MYITPTCPRRTADDQWLDLSLGGVLHLARRLVLLDLLVEEVGTKPDNVLSKEG